MRLLQDDEARVVIIVLVQHAPYHKGDGPQMVCARHSCVPRHLFVKHVLAHTDQETTTMAGTFVFLTLTQPSLPSTNRAVVQ